MGLVAATTIDTGQRPVILSTLPCSPDQLRLAWLVILTSGLVLLALAPFAKVQLPAVWAFIPIYEAALVVNDLITAALLFGQFNILRSRALLLLAGGYLFTALITIAHALTFPGLFAAGGLLGAGPQSTAWLYMFWHGGFPLLVICYVWRKSAAQVADQRATRPLRSILATIGLALAAVTLLTLLATAGAPLLPAIMTGNRYTPAMLGVVGSVWALSLLAFAVLYRQPHRSLLDQWLMVVMCAWMCDIALAAVLNGGRFDLGFYAGRIYGLFAASFVLVVLLLENSVLYARLVETHESEHRKSLELAVANRELEAFSYSVSHDLRAPLRAIEGFSKMLDEQYRDQLDENGHRLLGIVQSSSRRMGQLIEDLLTFSRLGRQPLRTGPVLLDFLVGQTIQELWADLGQQGVELKIGQLGTAEADASMLKQVFVNLISNAIKFSRKKSPARVEIDVVAGTGQASDRPKVYFVRDNGAGFDMQYASKLFGVFQRLHRADEFEGTGVGLAITQQIIHRHGGRIWADARPGEGATFYFTLQPGDVEEAIPATAVEGSASTGTRPLAA